MKPRRIGLAGLELAERIEPVAPRRRADERSEAFKIAQRRANNFRPGARVLLRRLINDNAIIIKSAQTIIIISAIEANTRAIRQLDPQFGFIDLNVGSDRGVVLEIAPGDVLGLHERGTDVAVARRRMWACVERGAPDQIIDS